ncbi:alpha/beta hydrolase [Methanobrevibacter sp.]|uniref:alpha/beta hydrolase n=1 Tax=Methanobrevibacter sp. TaxID=66852 RepID=UPI00388ED60A
MNKKLKIILIVAIVLILAYISFYLTDYYPAETTANDYMKGTENVSVVKEGSKLFLDGPGNDTALIFYPGAKVEYVSYLPLLSEVANRGVDCYLVEMPFNIAFFDGNAADAIMDNTNYTCYVLAGHSLGGVTAASYMNGTGKADGLILLSAYPPSKITKPVLSIYGSKDEVLDVEKYNESKPLMTNLTEFVIVGGNHEQFAYYGTQSGDGIASISPEDQQMQAADKIMEFIHGLS